MIKGKALKYGSNINTDIISPPQYMELSIEEASRYAMSPVDPDFYKKINTGDFFVAEKNLGSGSSRETSPLTLKYLGVSAVIAKSFARIFYRNCINLGLIAIECNETDRISENDQLVVDYINGRIINTTKNETYICQSLPDHIMKIIDAGGLVQYIRNHSEGNG